MGRVGGDESHHQPSTAACDPPPPPRLEEDISEPPEDYQPAPRPLRFHSLPSRRDDVVEPQAFPPQQENPQVFPPNQHFISSAQQNQNYIQPQQVNNYNMNVPQQGIPMHIQQDQPWNTHLFDCMRDPLNALITLMFPCVTFGQIAEILDHGGTSCCMNGILYSLIACIIGMPCLMSCGYRSKLRAMFGLEESPALDWVVHCLCEYCALCQEYRELTLRGINPSIGYARNVATQLKRHQFGMVPPPQQRMG